MITFVLIIHSITVVAIILLVLLQPSKGAGMSISSSQNILDSAGVGNFFTKATSYLAVLFFATSLAIVYLSHNNTDTLRDKLLQKAAVGDIPQVEKKVKTIPNNKSSNNLLKQSAKDNLKNQAVK